MATTKVPHPSLASLVRGVRARAGNGVRREKGGNGERSQAVTAATSEEKKDPYKKHADVYLRARWSI